MSLLARIVAALGKEPKPKDAAESRRQLAWALTIYTLKDVQITVNRFRGIYRIVATSDRAVVRVRHDVRVGEAGKSDTELWTAILDGVERAGSVVEQMVRDADSRCEGR